MCSSDLGGQRESRDGSLVVTPSHGKYAEATIRGNVYNARFGLIFNPSPAVCDKGYDPAEWRTPLDRADKAMDEDAHCAEPPSVTNARGAQNAPRTGAAYRAGTGTSVGTYDLDTGTMDWNDQSSASHVAYDGGAARLFGEDSWKSLLLQPVM